MTATTENLSVDDINDLLAKRRQVALIWAIQDVQQMRSDLNDDQAWKVLLHCRRVHAIGFGFPWMMIETVANSLFPLDE